MWSESTSAEPAREPTFFWFHKLFTNVPGSKELALSQPNEQSCGDQMEKYIQDDVIFSELSYSAFRFW